MVILSSDRRKIGVNYTQHLRGKMTIHDKMTITLLYKREKRESFGGTAKRFQKTLSLSLPIHIHNCSLLSARQGGEAQVSYSYAPTLKSAISHERSPLIRSTQKKYKNLQIIMPNNNTKYWSFTWQTNINQKTIPDENLLLYFLNKHCSNAVFQYEKGTLKEKLHIQGKMMGLYSCCRSGN